MFEGIKKVRLLVSILICMIAGIAGSLFTAKSIGLWFQTLEKPPFNPPNWVFSPVWIMLYTLMGISLYLVWEEGFQKREGILGVLFFGVQLVLNALWSILFFGLKSPYLAFLEIILLWFAILLTIIYFWKVSKKAAVLLVPYILWVSFAAVLNYYIWVLNP